MKSISILLLLAFSLPSLADCLPRYEEKLRSQKLVNILEAGATNTAVAGIGTQGALLAAGVATTTGLLTTGAGVVALGGLYTFTKIKQGKLTKVIKLIKEAKAGRGKTLSKFLIQLNKKSSVKLGKDEVIRLIAEANETELACEYDEGKDSYKLWSYKQFKKHIL